MKRILPSSELICMRSYFSHKLYSILFNIIQMRKFFYIPLESRIYYSYVHIAQIQVDSLRNIFLSGAVSLQINKFLLTYHCFNNSYQIILI